MMFQRMSEKTFNYGWARRIRIGPKQHMAGGIYPSRGNYFASLLGSVEYGENIAWVHGLTFAAWQTSPVFLL